jgi:hypothetical protein
MFNLFKKDAQLQKLSEEIERLTREVSALRAEKKDFSEQRSLQEKIIALKQTIQDLEISRDKKNEAFDRRERELTHMIGLEKKRQEFEIKQSVDNARLQVREENLKVEREQFSKDIKFKEDQLTKQIAYLQDIMKSLMERLPTVTVDKTIEEKGTRR